MDKEFRMLKSIIKFMKRGLPDREMLLPVLAGPFKGAHFFSRPQVALRKVFGVYEHELSNWLDQVLPQVDVVIDVGANDGYFTFGSARALQRARRPVHVIAIEPSVQHVRQLQEARARNGFTEAEVTIVPTKAGATDDAEHKSLNTLAAAFDARARVLIKVDVEGAELHVINGADRLLLKSNFFLIEVHSEELFRSIPGMFALRGIGLRYVPQSPHPLLGREHRDKANWWLVSQA
jgi:Methyltransferase FkbM domain